jgi:hypothetical protein
MNMVFVSIDVIQNNVFLGSIIPEVFLVKLVEKMEV